MSVDPLAIIDAIRSRYYHYLRTSFDIADPAIKSRFDEALEEHDLVKGPIIEATPPYRKGRTIRELIRDGVLSQRFRDFETTGLPLDRPLYLHQDQAIHRACSGRSLVVATGTGSGKTEIFLITLLDGLVKEIEAGTLTPGVRALLLYPMNALVNDQLKRMRDLLAKSPEITFGRYTGETPEKESEARRTFHTLYGHDPLPNELISREVMRRAPPNILLTNYAMLEYLLLRPDDNVFFDGEFAGHWRFLVLDEAHTYSGAKGIEMAMLLRRLKERVLEPGMSMQCIATSATLGEDEADHASVVTFAHHLFDEEVETDDVITAERDDAVPEGRWRVDGADIYRVLQQSLDRGDPLGALATLAAESAIPSDLVDQYSVAAHGATEAFVYHLLNDDRRLSQLRKSLLEGPQVFEETVDQVFPGDPAGLIALIDLARKVRSEPTGSPLLSARYHVFARTTEGAYLRFFPTPNVYLEPTKTVELDQVSYPVFELGVCRFCGAPFLLGQLESEGIGAKLEQIRTPGFDDDELPVQFFLLSSMSSFSEEADDEGEVSANRALHGEAYILCGRCGRIKKSTQLSNPCNCDEEYRIPLVAIKYDRETLHTCPVCFKTSPGTPVVSRFMFGKDTIPAVLSTAAYQEQAKPSEEPRNDRADDIVDDPWAPQSSSERGGRHLQSDQLTPGRLLIFSDSRQDAAFFAPFLNGTYEKILRRSVIISVLKKNASLIQQHRWRLNDLLQPIRDEVNVNNLLPGETSEEKNRSISRWLMYEFLQTGRVGSLAELGVLDFRVERPERWRSPPPLLAPPFSLSDDEAWTLFQVLLDSFRRSGAIRYLKGTSPDEDFFRPKNFQYGMVPIREGDQQRSLGWLPKIGINNARLDYLQRLLGEENPEHSRELLGKVWENFVVGTRSPFNQFFSRIQLTFVESGLVADPLMWQLVTPYSNPDVTWYVCDRCQNVTTLNIRGVCPTYRCPGTLQPIDLSKHKETNHYRVLYDTFKPVPMRACEHTAQLTSETASELQQQFIDGKVNVLSCSTTFELGVDVGELEVVFMRNMPPTASNYIQRAGRAGRRTDATAFVITFCQRRSHDLTFFNNPMSFVRGLIKSPYFELKNEKIVKRHVFATALASFWRDHRDTFGTVDDFFLKGGANGPEEFRRYLETHPDDLYHALLRIVPEDLYETVGITNWRFVDDLFGDELDDRLGLLTEAEAVVKDDIDALDRVRRERVENDMNSDHIRRLMRTIRIRPIISFLSAHNIIPKYGFPVDLVELQVMYPSETARQIELQRDLKIALSEYAPGSQVVAAGKIWRSQYIRRHPKRVWLKYRYVICDTCHRYHRVLAELDQDPLICEACEGDLRRSRKRGQFIIPEFGFLAANEEPMDVGERRPQKTYTTRVFYSGESKSENIKMFTFDANVTVRAETATQGKLAVINNAHGAGFMVCTTCGYTIMGEDSPPKTHRTSTNRPCRGKFFDRVSLGHEFLTDILELEFNGCPPQSEAFWLSLLYALLDGVSETLGINRDDIDGCLYPKKGRMSEPALILFDTVPGGAGHVKRVIETDDILPRVAISVLAKLKACSCGAGQGHSSCYGCLRNYQNQFCHDLLDRRIVIDFLEGILLAI